LDLRRIRYFVAVAEEGSFTRAAARLRISQPPLSQAIKALEHEMGVKLLTRNRRGVVPTDAGLVFLREARHIVGAFKTAIDKTLHVAAGKGGTLRIGAVSSSFYRVLPPILSQLQRRLPDASVTLMGNDSGVLTVALLRDEIDFAILHGPTNVAGLRNDLLATERMCAVVPRTHRLGRMRSIPVSALIDEEFVLFNREQAPGLFDSIVSLCERAGFSPKIKHISRDTPTMLQTVGLGIGVTIASESLRQSGARNTSFCMLNDPTAKVQYYLAQKTEGTSRLVETAVAITLRTART